MTRKKRKFGYYVTNCSTFSAMTETTPIVPATSAPMLTRRSCLAGALALGAGSLAHAQEHAARQHMTMNVSLSPDSLDPTTAPSASTAEVTHYNILEGLTKIEENGSVSPLLATSWEQDASASSYRLRLREGVRFHDGKPFDSAAVRFSFERAVAPGATNKSRRALFNNIASITTPDAHQVVLQLHHADANLPFRLGESGAVILHPDSAAQAAANPIGTGPYRLQRWQRGESVELLRDPSYRNAAHVRIKTALLRFISAPEAQEAALQANDIDLLFQYATRTVRRFQNDTRFQVLVGASAGKCLLALNNRRTPLNDVLVRRAINHAVDREAFIRRAMDGRGTAIGSHFAPSDAGFINLTSVYPFDPDKARALLKQANVTTPLKLQLALPPAPYAMVGGPVVAEFLGKVGIECTLEAMTWNQWLNGPFKGQFDMTLINHVEPLDYAIYADPAYYFGYDSATFRDLMQRHAQAHSARERQQLFTQIQRQLALDAVNDWICTPQIGTVLRKGLRGVWMNYPIFAHDIAAMWWD